MAGRNEHYNLYYIVIVCRETGEISVKPFELKNQIKNLRFQMELRLNKLQICKRRASQEKKS